MFDHYPDILSPKDISDLLHINLKTVYKLLHSGELPYRKIGTHYKIPKMAVINYLNTK